MKTVSKFAVVILLLFSFVAGAFARSGLNMRAVDVRFNYFVHANMVASRWSRMPNNVVPIMATVTNPDYSAANNVVNTRNDVGFVDVQAGDYRLCHGPGNPSPKCTAASQWVGKSTDGRDPGADINAVNQAIAGVN